MKRNIEICSRCPHFDKMNNICKKSGDEIMGVIKDFTQGVAAQFGIPHSFLSDKILETEIPFTQKSIPEECAMKTEYCLNDWNTEKKS